MGSDNSARVVRPSFWSWSPSVQRRLNARLDLEQVVTSISTEFISLPLERIDVGIDEALRIIGEFADVDRSYIFQLNEEGQRFSNTYEWCRDGIEPQKASLQDRPLSDFPWGFDRLRQDHVFHVPRVSALPREATPERLELERQDVQSIICVPMLFGGRFVGFIGFDSVRSEKDWSEETIMLLRIVGQMFVNALERKRVELALQLKQRRLEDQNRTLVQLAKLHVVGAQDMEKAVRTIAEAAAATLDVDRVSVWVLNDSRSRITCVDLFERALGKHSKGDELHAAWYPRYFKALEEERAIAAHDAQRDPRTMEFNESYSKPHNIGAMLDAPIRLGNRCYGIVCHEHVGPPRQWRLDEQNFAGSIGDLLALCFESCELAKAQRMLCEREARFRKILDTNPNLIFVKDWNGKFTLVNEAVAEIYGTSVEGLIGKGDGDFNKDWKQVEHFVNDDREVMTTGRVKIIPEESVTDQKTGEVRYFQTIKKPLLGNDGVAREVLGVATDITELKRAACERQRLQSEAEVAGRLASIGELAAGVAHEINNPLNGMINYAQLLLDRDPALSERQRVLGEVITEGQRIAAIVSNLLSFSRAKTDAFSVCKIEEVIQASLQLLQTQMEKEGIRILVNLPRATSSLRCIKHQIQQVFINLLSNARYALNEKFHGAHPDKLVELQVSESDGWMQIAFLDHGIGIPSAAVGKVFDPFFSTKPHGKGTGLGLSISYGIVEKHHGHIRVMSEEGRFTRVVVELPLAG